jgi:hypothetical protein
MAIDTKKLTQRREQDKSKFTHDAYLFKREGVRKGRPLGYWEQEGYSRIEPDGSIYTYLHSTPIGGFDGRIKSYPYGSAPPPDETGDDEKEDREPQRPGDGDGENY